MYYASFDSIIAKTLMKNTNEKGIYKEKFLYLKNFRRKKDAYEWAIWATAWTAAHLKDGIVRLISVY